MIDAIPQRDIQCAGVVEISDVGPIGTLADLQSADCFGDEKIEVGVALAMRVGGQIDRHVVPEGRHVGAVVEIVAAQVILIGLARA